MRIQIQRHCWVELKRTRAIETTPTKRNTRTVIAPAAESEASAEAHELATRNRNADNATRSLALPDASSWLATWRTRGHTNSRCGAPQARPERRRRRWTSDEDTDNQKRTTTSQNGKKTPQQREREREREKRKRKTPSRRQKVLSEHKRSRTTRLERARAEWRLVAPAFDHCATVIK